MLHVLYRKFNLINIVPSLWKLRSRVVRIYLVLRYYSTRIPIGLTLDVNKLKCIGNTKTHTIRLKRMPMKNGYWLACSTAIECGIFSVEMILVRKRNTLQKFSNSLFAKCKRGCDSTRKYVLYIRSGYKDVFQKPASYIVNTMSVEWVVVKTVKCEIKIYYSSLKRRPCLSFEDMRIISDLTYIRWHNIYGTNNIFVIIMNMIRKVVAISM